MPIAQSPQIASRTAGPWVGDATVSVSGMTVTVGGSVILPGLTGGKPDPTQPRVTTTLDATVAITAPASGVAHHLIAADWAGVLHLDPGQDVALAAYIAWFDVSAGTTDLGVITVNVLQQTDPNG